MIGVFLGSGGGLSGKVGRKEGGKKEKGRWTITEMRWNQRGFAAKGPPAPERPFAEQNRASGGASLYIVENEGLGIRFQEIKSPARKELVLRRGDLKRV